MQKQSNLPAISFLKCLPQLRSSASRPFFDRASSGGAEQIPDWISQLIYLDAGGAQ